MRTSELKSGQFFEFTTPGYCFGNGFFKDQNLYLGGANLCDIEEATKFSLEKRLAELKGKLHEG
jgi:hypothetical protein